LQIRQVGFAGVIRSFEKPRDFNGTLIAALSQARDYGAIRALRRELLRAKRGADRWQ
jgi:hypothetical protein